MVLEQITAQGLESSNEGFERGIAKFSQEFNEKLLQGVGEENFARFLLENYKKGTEQRKIMKKVIGSENFTKKDIDSISFIFIELDKSEDKYRQNNLVLQLSEIIFKALAMKIMVRQGLNQIQSAKAETSVSDIWSNKTFDHEQKEFYCLLYGVFNTLVNDEFSGRMSKVQRIAMKISPNEEIIIDKSDRSLISISFKFVNQITNLYYDGEKGLLYLDKDRRLEYGSETSSNKEELIKRLRIISEVLSRIKEKKILENKEIEKDFNLAKEKFIERVKSLPIWKINANVAIRSADGRIYISKQQRIEALCISISGKEGTINLTLIPKDKTIAIERNGLLRVFHTSNTVRGNQELLKELNNAVQYISEDHGAYKEVELK